MSFFCSAGDQYSSSTHICRVQSQVWAFSFLLYYYVKLFIQSFYLSYQEAILKGVSVQQYKLFQSFLQEMCTKKLKINRVFSKSLLLIINFGIRFWSHYPDRIVCIFRFYNNLNDKRCQLTFFKLHNYQWSRSKDQQAYETSLNNKCTVFLIIYSSAHIQDDLTKLISETTCFRESLYKAFFVPFQL